jgi:hypothetical protein
MADLDELMAEHMHMPFPPNVVKGLDYGEVDPVMIGADIYGWAIKTCDGRLSPIDRDRLVQARDELARSLDAFPAEARPYYEKVLEMAVAALAGPHS